MKYLKLAPYILPIFAFFLYLFTAAPFMLWLDAPRFVAAIASLGVPNPPEPLYILLAKAFTYIPFGSIIFKLQVFSALSAAGTLFVLYKLTNRIMNSLTAKKEEAVEVAVLASIFAVATLAFSYQFWSQAQNVETFILVTLIEVICLYLILTASTKKRFFINLSIISLLMGLATGTNPVIASIIPSLLWVMWHKRKFWSIPGFIVWIVVGVVAIVVIHLYIPIRAAADPFLNYWRATTLEGVWHVSTGEGLNVYVPELGRINGFTGSPEIFIKSTWHFIEMWFIKFTPLLLPFMVAGAVFLWKKSKYFFVFLFLIIATNWFFAGLYFSGNQESWFLVSDICWAILAGLGYYWLVTEVFEIILLKLKQPKEYKKYAVYFILVTLVPLIVWSFFLYRRDWRLTEDYINNLYKPMGEEKSILFGSSDLYDSVSFYVHDIPGTSVYKPNVVPITDNLLYILRWYRDNLRATTDLKIPDDANLKYDSADEYSIYVNEFFAQNIDKYKIFITTPAMRNNFLHVYKNKEDLTGSLKVDEKRFKLIPQGMLMQVVLLDSTVQPDPNNFEFTFRSGFPKNKPRMLEQTYKTELTGVINEFAYSLENLGDISLKSGKADDAFKFYQQAYDFNPKNAEIISRLGNYYGNIGNHTKAAEFFEKALKLEPRNIGLLFNTAIAYENTGRIDRAIASLTKVLQLAPGNSQIGQLAKARLDILKTATPSAIATSSGQQKVVPPGAVSANAGSLQQQLLPPQLPPGIKQFSSEDLNLQFLYPSEFTLTNLPNGIVSLSNNLKGKDELTFNFASTKLAPKDDLEVLSQKTALKMDAPVLITQPLQIPGFEALGKTYGSGEHLTFLLLLKKGDQGISIKIYPGDSNKTEQFNQVLGTIRTIK